MNWGTLYLLLLKFYPFHASPHNNIKPPHADLYRLDVRNIKSAPVAERKLTFGTSSRLERVTAAKFYEINEYLWIGNTVIELQHLLSVNMLTLFGRKKKFLYPMKIKIYSYIFFLQLYIEGK